MIWYSVSDRQELLRILGGGAPNAHAISAAGEVRVSRNECGLLWRRPPHDFPNAPPVVVIVSDVPDFIAWASTYLPNYRPITAYFRVVHQRDLSRFTASEDQIGIGQLSNALLGAIVAESYLRNVRSHEPGRPSLSNLLGTCSFALARTFAVQSVEAYEDVISRWYAVSVRTGQKDQDRPLRDTLSSVWSRLAELQAAVSLGGGGSSITHACQQIIRKGYIDERTWFSLVGTSPSNSSPAEIIALPRERRLEWLELVGPHVTSRSGMNPELVSFVTGYLFSLLAPGTLEHLTILGSSTSMQPQTIMWYAVCAGLYPRSDVQNFAGGILRRVLRDIEAWELFVDRPRSDVGADELELLRPLLDGNSSPLVVEVAPRVYGVFGAPARREVTPQTIDTGRLEELGRLLSGATDLYFELTHPEEQGQLDFRRPKQGRKGSPKSR